MNGNPELFIRFFPTLPWALIAILGFIAVALLIYAIINRARGWPWRFLALALLVLMLLNPSLVEEKREEKPDYVLMVVDQSTSNQINNRDTTALETLDTLQQKLSAMPNIETRVLYIGDNNEDHGGTMLFSGLARGSADIPRNHIGAVIMITDGQVHDAPVLQNGATDNIPMHVLLTGNPDEKDRRLRIVRNPGFGLVGQQQKITVHVEDNLGEESTVSLTMRRDGEAAGSQIIPVGQDVEIPVTITHAAANIFELSITQSPHEISEENNHAVVTINGVRDRLRVLLISGDPHQGTRVWRNFLKSDPSVDLVHFTILRPPEKQDSIPTEELSLIAFPTKELFEDKLNEFNLIIFDRYRRLSVLPAEYMTNIVHFVERGGALLDAEGPLPDNSLSLFDTAVGNILPSIPTQKSVDAQYTPSLTAEGLRHPVTAGLPGASKDGKNYKWGHWFRQMDATARRGNILMTGIENKPLLVLDRVGEGRVAQLFSDQIWLWARGFEGGGPHSELLRRLAHWLMKEPQLEENDLRVEVQGRTIAITQRSLQPASTNIILTKPGNETEQVALTEESPGLARGKITVNRTGLYRVSNGNQSIMVGVGGLNPLEYADLRSSREKLAPYAESTGGSIRWLSENGTPEPRRMDANRYMSGKNWIGIKRNKNYTVTGIKQTELIPPVAYMLGALLFLFFAWRREGK